MIQLTEEQADAVEQAGKSPVTVRDPKTNASYVLVRKEVFKRMRLVFDDETLDSGQVAALIEKTMREYEDGDPLLDSYQKYRP